MSKKLLAILFLLIAVPAVLYFVAKVAMPPQPVVKTPQSAPSTQQNPQTQIPLATNAQTTLTFSPAQYSLSSTSGSIDILIDSGANNASAVQLEISYDPAMLKNVAITAGPFFANPLELLKKINQTTGRISYAFGAALSDKGKTGKGTVATISFTSTLPKGQNTTITLLPQTIVTAEKEENSVLKETASATITNP